MKKYDKNLDRDFFTSKGVTVVQHQPWQFSLIHEKIRGKFVWYPERGSLMYETGAYSSHKVGEYHSSEEVWVQMQKKIV